jgi:hypothetical protein
MNIQDERREPGLVGEVFSMEGDDASLQVARMSLNATWV